jgi:hypothetical protein
VKHSVPEAQNLSPTAVRRLFVLLLDIPVCIGGGGAKGRTMLIQCVDIGIGICSIHKAIDFIKKYDGTIKIIIITSTT